METSRKITTTSIKHKQLAIILMNNIQPNKKRPKVADFIIKRPNKMKTTQLQVNPYHEAILDDTILQEYYI